MMSGIDNNYFKNPFLYDYHEPLFLNQDIQIPLTFEKTKILASCLTASDTSQITRNSNSSQHIQESQEWYCNLKKQLPEVLNSNPSLQKNLSVSFPKKLWRTSSQKMIKVYSSAPITQKKLNNLRTQDTFSNIKLEELEVLRVEEEDDIFKSVEIFYQKDTLKSEELKKILDKNESENIESNRYAENCRYLLAECGSKFA